MSKCLQQRDDHAVHADVAMPVGDEQEVRESGPLGQLHRVGGELLHELVAHES